MNLCPPHPQDGAVEVYVFTACQLRVKPGPHLEQTRYSSSDANPTAGRLCYPAEDLEQCRLAGTVATDDAKDLPLFYLERYVFERPELRGFRVSYCGWRGVARLRSTEC